MAQLFGGTSGFAYATWKPDFYPEKLAAKKFLGHYATRLNAVEINYTFRRLLSSAVIEGWLAETPLGFVFAIKAHQRITHIDRLAVSEFTRVFFQSIDPLRVQKRLGPVLIQLPPNLAFDGEKLAAFLKAAPEDLRLAFEFRNKSWFVEETYALLEKHNAALCLAESEKLVVPERITVDWVYFRMRKASYSPEDRAEIEAKARQLLEQGKDVYVFFKHEDDPAGALYAEEILASIKR
ncbi:MAG: DUF72 domain-containing protein [Bryobacteraceae bacterium]|nr:DUF72 domain-containing protein [Bryobacteraceae bacterium]